MSGKICEQKCLPCQFIEALFIEKDFIKAQNFCDFPLNVTYQNITSEIKHAEEFEQAFSSMLADESLASPNLLSAQHLFRNSEVQVSFLELVLDITNISLSVHITAVHEKIRSLHFLFNEPTVLDSNLKNTTIAKSDYNKVVAALEHTGILFWEYHPFYDQGTINIVNQNQEQKIYNNFTEMLIRFLNISPSSHRDLISLHEAIIYGQTEVSSVVKIINADGDEEWRKIRYSTVNTEDNQLIAIGTSENINELKQLEKRFSVATAQTGVSIWNYDIETRTLTLENKPDSNFFEENVFLNAPDSLIDNGLLHPDDVEKYKEMFQRIERGDALISSEVRFLNPVTNEYVWHQVVFSVALDNEGYPNSVIGTSVNIHNQKNAENTYRQELQLLETEHKSTLLSMVYSVNDKKIVRIKTKLPELCQDQKLEELRSALIKLCPNIEHKKLLLDTIDIKHFIHLSNQQPSEETIYAAINTPADESIWTEFNIILIKNPVTMEIYAKISIKDVTESYILKMYTEKLSKQKFDYILRVNYISGKYTLIMSSEAKQSLSKIPFTGNFHHDTRLVSERLLAKDELNAYLESISIRNIIRRFKEEGDFDILFRTKNSNGSIRYKRSHLFMFDETTTTFCMGCIDVTDTHELEQERNDMLRQSLQMAQEANKAKSSFLASMSHDIRTPMNAIIGMVNLAIEDQENKQQVSESLNVIKSSSEHLLSLINDILEMNRIESGKATLNNAPFDITEECTNIANTFKGIVIAKDQTFKFELENIKTEHVIGDISNFKRILTNLLGNAVKFTPKHGSITFRVIEEANNNENLALFRIEITDTGIGIAKDQLSKIFEPFQREVNNTVKNIEGTGLGLAIVKALIEMQGGAINVESEKGKGTTFTLHISYEKTEKQALAAETKPVHLCDIDLKGKHILLVEDHPVNILVASKLLGKMGAEIIKAENGKIGLDKFLASKDKEIDLIFMDLQMPVMDGLACARAIRSSKHPNAKTVPIIAMTANAFAEDVHNSLNAGMNAHIAKPITLENINNTLKKLTII